MKKNSLREWVSLQIAKNPRGMILLVILLLNIVFILTAAVVMGFFSLHRPENRPKAAAAYFVSTVSIVLFAAALFCAGRLEVEGRTVHIKE